MIKLACLFYAFAIGPALESIALKAATVMPVLLLQKFNQKSKLQEHTACLEWCLRFWENEEISEMVNEGRAIQSHIPKISSHKDKDQLSRSFTKLIFLVRPRLLYSCCRTRAGEKF